MDALWKAAGINTAVENDDDVQQLLTRAAMGFLRAGGVLSLAEYSMLDGSSRAAFMAAHDALRVEQAARIGQAVDGPLGVAQLMAELDDGDTLCELACRLAAERAARKLAAPATGRASRKAGP